jgi:hypothetical protein
MTAVVPGLIGILAVPEVAMKLGQLIAPLLLPSLAP